MAMEGRSTLPARKELHPRLVSITPSESPPVSRLFQTLTSNRLNKAPVSKRPRLSSTPSSLFSTASSSTIVHTEEIDEGLRASSMRLLSVWDQLAERYNRPLDEDDIVDLRDNSLFKDRGVVRQSRRTYEIGCFGDDNSRSDANDASSEGGDVPYDDDVDELDAFAPEADISGKLELEKGKLNVPPMREMDPDDAQDLREFMEAEARRKELYGDEEGEDGEENGEDGDEWGAAVEDIADVRFAYGDGVLETDFEDNLDTKDDYADFDFSKASDEPILVPDGDSEDEFATWDFDASSAKPVTCHSNPAPEIEALDLTDTPSPSPSPSPSKRAKSNAPSRGSSGPPLRSCLKPAARAQSKTPAQKKVGSPARPPDPDPVLQLCTPPQSCSPAFECMPNLLPESTPQFQTASPPPRPSQYQGQAQSSISHIPGLPPTTPESPILHLDIAESSNPPRNKVSKKTLSTPEVVITSRPKTSVLAKNSSKASPSERHITDRGDDAVHADDAAPKPVLLRRDKGKRKETAPDSGSVNFKSKPARVKPKEYSSHEERHPPTVNSSRQRKRKRVISSGSSLEVSPQAESNPRPARSVPPVKQLPLRPIASEKMDKKARASSLRPGDEFNDSTTRNYRNHSRARSLAPQMPPSDTYPCIPQRVPPPAVTEYYLALALYNLAREGYTGQELPQAPPLPLRAPQWPPQTPARQRHRSVQSLAFDTPSSEAGPSTPSSSFRSPSHNSHSYQYSFDPSFSGASLPPSSPTDCSDTESVIERSASIARTWRESTARRVSFRVDSNDKPLPPMPSVDGDSNEGPATRRRSGRIRISDGYTSDTPRRGNRGAMPETPIRQPPSKARLSKLKGVRAELLSDSDDEDLPDDFENGARGRRFERARTPGPPSRQSRSLSTHAIRKSKSEKN